MAQFDSADLLEDEKKTKERLKTALAKVNAGGTKFIYYDKFKLGTKEVPLVLVDLAADMQAQVKAKFGKVPTGLGRCHLDEADKLVFDFATGSVKLDRLKTFLSSIGVARELSDGEAAPVPTKPKTVDGPVTKTSEGDARSELSKRVAAFAAQLKSLKPELRDSFESQLKKVGTLAATNEPAALKLLGQLDEMLKKAQAKGSGEEIGAIGSTLAEVKTEIDKAVASLPKTPDVLQADLEKTPEYLRYAAFVKSPTSIPDAATLKSCVALLHRRIELMARQATDWPKIKESAEAALKKLLTEAQAAVGKANTPKLATFKDFPEAKLAISIGNDPHAYARIDEFEPAMQAVQLKVKALIQAIKDWTLAAEQAGQAVEGEIGRLGAELREAVRKALATTSEQTAFDQLIERGKKEVLAANALAQPGADLAQKVRELGEIEARRMRSAKLAGELPPKRVEFDDFLRRCNAALTKATAPLDDVALSFRSATMNNEIQADTLTCTTARNGINALVLQLDNALLALRNEPPPLTAALDDAAKLLTEALPDINAARERITKNLAALGPEGRARTVERLLDQAKTDPARMLSNNRAGNMAKAVKAMKLNEAIQAIADAVAEQHRPKLKEWFTVLQLKNASSGKLKLGTVGDIVVGGATGKRVPLHMSLFLANVGNPHYFHGAAAGVANDLGGDPDWPGIEAQMQAKLQTEMARLTALVQQHVARMGKWPGE
ncbi:MAG TPA: hypothetical protein VKI18_10180 [Albitalea sp.]|nr:hypothetical protein [Albitalea sp.]